MGISFSGSVLTLTAFSATENTGWLRWSTLIDSELVHLNPQQMFLHLLPSDHSGGEQTDVVIQMAFDSAGSGAQDLHVFTQVTSTNAIENVVLPGEESTGFLTAGTDLLPAPIPPWYKITSTVDGATARTFTLYGHILFS